MITVLLTNDDGIGAPGLLAMERAFNRIDNVDLWIIAPDGERSACSHGMSLSKPVCIEQYENKQKYAISGLVADCVYFGLYWCLPQKPHVVVSGINKGANLGTDVIYSGTVAGAREAAIRGIHGLSVSMVSGDDFEAAATNAAQIAVGLASLQARPSGVLNINYPSNNFKPPRLAPLGKRIYPTIVQERKMPVSGKSYFWLGASPVKDANIKNTDGWLIGQGIASATWLLIDQTDQSRHLVQGDNNNDFINLSARQK